VYEGCGDRARAAAVGELVAGVTRCVVIVCMCVRCVHVYGITLTHTAERFVMAVVLAASSEFVPIDWLAQMLCDAVRARVCGLRDTL
jgi:hypothetical protein